MKKELTRRAFLCLAGKGLASLAFAGAAFHFGLPTGFAQSSSKISVNQLVTGENEMRFVFLKRADKNKSDAFYIISTTPQGMELFLVDGGRSNKLCRDELLALRSEILTRAGLESEIPQSTYLLDIKVIISHFHGDHIGDLHENIAPYSHKIRINAVYYPAATRLPQRSIYNDQNNADLIKRSKVLSAIRIHNIKACTMHEVPFGETMDVPALLGTIRLYASPVDWGVGEHLKWMESVHFAAKPQNIPDGMATEVLNGNCLWARVACGGHSVLFTGDTNKKFDDRTDESFDLFLQAYGEELRSDIVKFPHHGRGRDAACLPTKTHLLTSHPEAACILSGVDGPELAGVKLTALGVKWLDLNTKNAVYTITARGLEQKI